MEITENTDIDIFCSEISAGSVAMTFLLLPRQPFLLAHLDHLGAVIKNAPGGAFLSGLPNRFRIGNDRACQTVDSMIKQC